MFRGSRRQDNAARGQAAGPSNNALFRAYPPLAETLPLFPLTRLPTPVEPSANLGAELGIRDLWIKRDDRSGINYGGNKPRKLEFIIGQAVQRGVKRIITIGGLGTNHGLATALATKEAGIDLTLVLVRQPVTDSVRLALKRFAALGAELIYGEKLARTAALTAAAVLRHALKVGHRPMLVPAGGSSPVGTLGQVAAALELKEQVERGELPCPEAIFVAAGSGGTAAGLAAGLKLAGLPTRVVAVLVNNILPPTPASMSRLANRTISLLREGCSQLPAVKVKANDIRLVSTELGVGYGTPTTAGLRMIDLARRTRGISLDPVYTAKAFAGMTTEAKKMGLLEKPILFWLTYSSIDPGRAIGPLPDPSALPPPFLPFFS